MCNKNVFLTDVDYPSYSWFGFCVFSHLQKLTSHFLLDFSSSKRPRYTYGWPGKHKNLSEWRNTYVKHIYRPYYWSYWAHHYYQEFRQRAKAYLSWGWKTLQINWIKIVRVIVVMATERLLEDVLVCVQLNSEFVSSIISLILTLVMNVRLESMWLHPEKNAGASSSFLWISSGR